MSATPVEQPGQDKDFRVGAADVAQVSRTAANDAEMRANARAVPAITIEELCAHVEAARSALAQSEGLPS